MTVWLLILFSVQASQIQGVGLVASFRDEPSCIGARQQLGAMGQNVRHSRCVEVSLAEGA